MLLRLTLLPLVAACGRSDADLLLEALSAADHAVAALACGRLSDVEADRCRVSVAALHHRDEAADCAAVVDPLWRDECDFQLAERFAVSGRAAEAVALCAGTRFVRECSYHLLREVARSTVGRSPLEAATALDPWRDLPTVRDAPRLFWKAWFREGRAAGGVVSPVGCPDAECEGAARETLFESLRALHRADPVGFCAAPPGSPPGWADAAMVASWAAHWSADTCARDAAAPPRAIPPSP